MAVLQAVASPIETVPNTGLYWMVKRGRYHAHAAIHTLVDSIDFIAPFYCA